MINCQLKLKLKVQPSTFPKVKCFMTSDTLDEAFSLLDGSSDDGEMVVK